MGQSEEFGVGALLAQVGRSLPDEGEPGRARTGPDSHRAPGPLEAILLRHKEIEAGDVREDLLRTWVDASNAGGAVGFVPPTSTDQVAPTLDRTLARVRDGLDDLVALRSTVPVRADDGTPVRHVAMAVLVDGESPLTAHWRTVIRVMVHPAIQGTGAGRLLMEATHDHARDRLGLEHLVLQVRTGQGIEPFYERLGYRVIGRHPQAIAVAPDDVRDEVIMHLDLRRKYRPGPT